MTATTAKYLLPYPVGTDPVKDGENTIQALATLVDLLLGETGTDSITPSAANTTTTKRVNYARSYAALPSAPRAFLNFDAAINSTDAVFIWVSGEDATGFTLNIKSQSTTAKAVRWNCRAR
jgi:hypothetical protein